jgi:ABC-type Fe3+-siderophore transport system permease subunit
VTFWTTLGGLVVAVATALAVYFHADNAQIAVVFFGIAISAALGFAITGTRDTEDGVRSRDAGGDENG